VLAPNANLSTVNFFRGRLRSLARLEIISNNLALAGRPDAKFVHNKDPGTQCYLKKALEVVVLLSQTQIASGENFHSSKSTKCTTISIGA